MKQSVIDRKRLPPMHPTHRHTPQFWEHLGRTIATYGFLEEVLGKAIFSFTATREYAPDDLNAAYQAWLPQLERALTDPLGKLASSYQKAAHENPDTTTKNIDELVSDIKEASVIRNVLCHGSWRSPDDKGASTPLFVNRDKQRFEKAIDIAYLQKQQKHVAGLAFSVIDTVTHMGWQFPGGAGPGNPIIKRD